MTDQYKIHSIYYTKPSITRDANGEVVYYRYGCCVTVGIPAPFDGQFEKKVTRIEFNEETNSFRVYFDKGGLKTVPFLADTEVTYENITDKKK